MNLDTIFDDIKNHLDKLDEKRERILPITREIVRKCSDIIKNIHRNELTDIDSKIKEIKELIASTKEYAWDTLQGIGKNYMGIVYQEFTEAVAFYHLITEKTLPSYAELEVNPYEYLLGLSDLLGELKRMILNKIRIDDIETAEILYDYMESIHEYLFGLDYPSGLLPGFRKKIDKARALINSTLEIIVSSKQIRDLKDTLHQSTQFQ
ncbi:MAG: hypothetical protein JW776_15070 [Candidatus Lokiarchaeota archaeon]|nr:hypothetical protein [Candidatus Lokiarchaeota archaeon]